MSLFPMISTKVADPAAARDLIALLDGFVPQLEAFGEQPVLIADAPHRFNDTYEDDYWCAVRSDATWWEQSQFFIHVARPKATESSSFAADPDAAAAFAPLMSERIADLRTILHHLNKAGWRKLVDKAFSSRTNLHALIVEYGQTWLFLDQVNGGDGDAFAWDAEGFFHVGSMDRLDQVGTRPQLLLFERLDVDGLDRLNAWGQHYFLPDIVDPVAGTRLANAIHAAIEPIRAVTADAVALCAQGSRTGVEYDIAALCRTALAGLKAADWRAELGRAIGDPLDRGQAVAAVFDGDDLVLTRDNAVLAVMASGLQVKGALSYPELTAPRRVLENVRLSGR